MKADIWDAGHRIPFLARWPGKIKPGTVSNQLGCLTDLMATVADIVDFKLPKNAGEDSYDLLPALLGRARSPIRKAIVHHSNSGVFSIREQNWKLELGLGSGGFSAPQHEDPVPGGPAGAVVRPGQRSRRERERVPAHPEVVTSA